MRIVAPEPGLVIAYDYLWRSQAALGRTEGVKTRPVVIVLAVVRADGRVHVVVLPVTHSPPRDADDAVELPVTVKRHLGLDDARSWVVVTEGNRFDWPGPDLRPDPATGRIDYGFLPPRLFARIKQALVDRRRAADRDLLVERP